MNQNKQAPRRRMTRREWRIRRCLHLARNWAVFLAACGAAVALMTSGILWLLPKAHALIAGPEAFVARNYDGTEYQLNLADARLVLVNGNLPLDAEPAPALAVADDATGQQLEAEAAEQYRAMAAAAAADGITLGTWHRITFYGQFKTIKPFVWSPVGLFRRWERRSFRYARAKRS